MSPTIVLEFRKLFKGFTRSLKVFMVEVTDGPFRCNGVVREVGLLHMAEL